MLVSIITSVYNCEKYVSEMIDSILAQTYKDWELIIFDDASADNTWDIISNYQDCRIKKFRNKENQGLTVNLNKALKLAEGKYIARIDGDDIAYPRRLEKQVAFMENNSDVVLSGCWMKSLGLKEYIMQNEVDCEVLKINLLFGPIIFHPSFIMRHTVLNQYHIHYNETLKYAQDYDMQYQFSKYGKIRNLPEILMKYRFHEEQVTTRKIEEQKFFAGITRKRIINDLGLKLTEEECIAWNHFGTFETFSNLDDEIEYIKNIIQKILAVNKTKQVYCENILQHITSARLKNYINSSRMVDQNQNSKNDKYHRMFLMMAQWKRLNKQGICLEVYFKQKNIRSIAIYGMGHAGRALAEELVNSSVTVKYGIDRNIEGAFGIDDMAIVTLEERLEKIDAIVVTVISQYENIKKELEKKIECSFYSLEEIIYSM